MAYLYRHIRLDKNIPFYIGIGNDKRFSRANCKNNRSNVWKNIVNVTEYEVEILFVHDDYGFIKEKEKEFIALHGRRDLGKGPLVNMTDGGEGMLGYVMPDELRKKHSDRQKGEKNHMWGKKLSDYEKHIRSIALKDVKRPDLAGDNHPFFNKKRPDHSLKLKGRKYEEGRVRLSGEKNPMYGKNHTEEAIRKMSESCKGKYAGEKNPMFGRKRPEVGLRSKELCGYRILDTSNGKTYSSMKEAAEGYPINYNTLKQYISGKYPNKTTLIKIDK